MDKETRKNLLRVFPKSLCPFFLSDKGFFRQMILAKLLHLYSFSIDTHRHLDLKIRDFIFRTFEHIFSQVSPLAVGPAIFARRRCHILC